MNIFKKAKSWTGDKAESIKNRYTEKVIGTPRLKQNQHLIKEWHAAFQKQSGVGEVNVGATFSAYVQMLNLNDEKLKVIHDRMMLIAQIFAFFAIIAAIWGFAIMFIEKDIMQGFMLMVFGVMFGAFMFKYSFKAFQVRHRDFLAPAAWVQVPGEWLGGEFEIKPRNRSLAQHKRSSSSSSSRDRENRRSRSE